MNRHYPEDFLGQLSFITNLSFPLSLSVIVITTLVSLQFSAGNNKRLIAWWCGIYAGVFLSPFTAHFFMDYLTTTNTYWRLFHGYPIPLVIGITAAGLYSFTMEQTRFRKTMIIFVSAVALSLPHIILISQIVLTLVPVAIKYTSANIYTIGFIRLVLAVFILSFS